MPVTDPYNGSSRSIKLRSQRTSGSRHYCHELNDAFPKKYCRLKL